jgi:hypothetical protein
MNDFPIRTLTPEQKENLHRRFSHYGSRHLESRRICIGMLPEIFNEKIYAEKGFESILEYAAILAGLSHDQVKRALSLHSKFEDKPALKNLLENGEVSINKLARVVSISTIENQEELAELTKKLSQSALETFVKDERNAKAKENQDGSHEPLFDQNFAPLRALVRAHKIDIEENKNALAQPLKLLELKISAKNLEEILELQEKGIDIDDLLTEMLMRRKKKIEEKKEAIAAKCKPTDSRYIPKETRDLLEEEYGDKCSFTGCNKPSKEKHHTQRFAIEKIHDPFYLAPACEDHHEIAHTIDKKYRQKKREAVNSA